MALVKSNNSSDLPDLEQSAHAAREAEAKRKKARTLAKQQQAAERIASATEQLVSGVSEASAAAEELKRASDQIATTAEESSGAAQESLAAFRQINQALELQMQNANTSRQRTDSVRNSARKTAEDINNLVQNVSMAAERQGESVKMVAELEKQAANIGDIVKAVARIADQTNLLALNAAIEAARAGKHGKGFAVVADEVRTLAETSEKSARQIQELVSDIQGQVKTIADGINQSAENVTLEVEKGRNVTTQLEQIREDMGVIVKGAEEIAVGAEQSSAAAMQALKSSEAIAAAAEEQSAAAEESAKTVDEQSSALGQCDQSAQLLAELADDLRNSTDINKSAEEVASSAEELSSAVQEINRAASQIMTAIDQISKGAQTAAGAAAESAAAVGQIESGVSLAQERATVASDRVSTVLTLLQANRASVTELIGGIESSVKSTRESLRLVQELERKSRQIDKIVEAITTVSIQTSMLAVNGSIEAARAGEFGKGFVVVSTDIRNLAHDSAENADRIKDLVKNIQDQIVTVIADLEGISEEAMEETRRAAKSATNLEIMERDATQVADGNTEILSAANAMVESIAEAKKGIDQISTAAQLAEKAASEASSAASQQSSGADELAAAIEEIASLADELQSL